MVIFSRMDGPRTFYCAGGSRTCASPKRDPHRKAQIFVEIGKYCKCHIELVTADHGLSVCENAAYASAGPYFSSWEVPLYA
jgi:hypothetical protein